MATITIPPEMIITTEMKAEQSRSRAIESIKREARRRIVSVYPEWAQANMTARGVELTNIRHERQWTVEEEAEAAVLQQAWDWIKAARAASNALEDMDPLPDDITDSALWPEWLPEIDGALPQA